MQRQPWFEIHDSAWFPAYLRDLVTEALEAIWNSNRTYVPIAGRLRDAVRNSGSRSVVDLCSGGGGPWPGLYDIIADGQPLSVRLTDLYPNAGFRSNGRLPAGISACRQPVDARHVPEDLHGFRTIFSSFHHFDPEAARALLADAFRRREGIGVFEAARRTPGTMLSVAGVAALSLRTAAAQRLRSYSLEDMHELTAGLTAPDYAWQMGDEHGGTVPIRYLIGTPQRRA
jgi:hypothetical protein